MSHQPAQEDTPRDAHLLAALRHAPDHDVAPPTQLSAAILAQAQQALRGGRPTWRDGLREALGKLWQPAPLAAFGTLAMATLIGLMWGTQQIPDATPGLRPESAAAPVQESSAASAVARPIAVAPARQLDDASAREAVAVASRTAKPQAPAPKPAAVAKAAVATAPPPAAPAGARQDAPQEPEARRGSAIATAPRAAVPEAADAATAATPPAAVGNTAALQRGALDKSMADAAPASAQARARSEGAAPAAPAALGATAPALASPLARAAAEIDAAMAVDASRVRWRVMAQRLAAHDAAQRDWWAALVRGTQGRWQPVATSSASGAESEPIMLLIDGAPRGSLSFELQALVWRDAGGATWRAPIAAPTLRGWQEAITRW